MASSSQIVTWLAENLRPFSLLLALLPGLAFAQELWRGTTYGMSPTEVREAVPEAVASSKPETLGSGAKCELWVPDLEIVSNPYSACFYFLDGKLTQVSVTRDRPESYRLALIHFESMLEALRAKYGKEMELSVDESGLLQQRRATWMSGRTNITLFVSGMGKDESFTILRVIYQVRLAMEADKL